MAAYTYAQLEAFALGAGFPQNIAPIMAAIAMAESGGRADAIQQGQPYGSRGWGLWQITPGNSAPQFGTDQQLLNPVNNAKAAFWKWKSAGGNTAALRSQWTTYSSGAYLQFMRNGVPPDPAGAAQGAANQAVSPEALGSGIPGIPDPTAAITGAISSGLATVFGPLTKSVEHMFDVTMNNLVFVLLTGAGLAMMGVGLTMMVKETPVGPAVTNVIQAVARKGVVA